MTRKKASKGRKRAWHRTPGKNIDPKTGKPRMGAPKWDYDPKIGDRICAALVDKRSLRRIVKMPGMPAVITIMRWLRENPEFAAQYARAREEQAEVFADEIVTIADGVRTTDSNVKVQGARLRVDARKWIAAKLKPKKYGELVRQEISGPDGRAIASENVEKIDVSKLSAKQIEDYIREAEDRGVTSRDEEEGD